MADANVAELEAQVKKLEVEVSEKDSVISALQGGSSAAPAMPPAPPAEAAEILVYDDDKALGAECPTLAGLTFHNGAAFDVKDKVTVITHFCNLNKGDFVTMTVLSDIQNKYKDSTNWVAISRDHEDKDCAKWVKKYNGTFMAEQKGPNGEAGVTVRCDFPMAHDPEHNVNAALKEALKKAVIGVGFTIIVDKEGKIQFYETYSRGQSLVGQFEYQLHAIVNGLPVIKNGPTPEFEEEEVEGGGEIPDDIDFLATGDGNY